MKTLFYRSRSARQLKRLIKKSAVEGKPLSVMDDAVFKAMLTDDTDDSREALRSLLSACTRRQVSQVQVVSNEPVPAHLDAKAVRLDVNVTFNDGEAADLEMQIGKSDDDLKARAALCAAMLLAGQSRKGHPYREIKRVYQIFFLNCKLFPDSEKLPRRYSYREEVEHDRLTEATEIIFYEMPKLEKKVKDILEGKRHEPLSEDEKWCTYMKYIRKMNILKNSMDRAQRIYDIKEAARTEGRTEGLEEGRTEGKLEIAWKMKNAGRPLNEIAEFTELPIETIETL